MTSRAGSSSPSSSMTLDTFIYMNASSAAVIWRNNLVIEKRSHHFRKLGLFIFVDINSVFSSECGLDDAMGLGKKRIYQEKVR